MLEALLTPVDLYCERTGPQVWSEPLNALTNLASVAAGLWGLALARRSGADGFVRALGWLVVAIGLGSGLFHTVANRLTVWFDVVPIALFILAYTVFVLRRFLLLGWLATAAGFAAFHLAAGAATAAIPAPLVAASNGSVGYLPGLAGLALFGALLAARGRPAGRAVLAAAAVFVVSLTMRAIDPRVCAALPIGTHFLWHLLNATVLAILLAAAVRHGAARARHLPQEKGAGA